AGRIEVGRPLIAFSPTGKTLAGIGKNSLNPSIRLWDVATGRQIWTRSKFPGFLTCFAFSPDGTTIAVGGDTPGGTTTIFPLRLLDAATGRMMWSPKGPADLISYAVRFSPPDGKRLADVGGDNLTRIWDLATRQVVRTLPNPVIPLSAVFSPDGRRLVIGDGD